LPEPIYVTRPYLPPLDEILPLLGEIWSTRILTNRGPLHERLQAELQSFLGVANVTLTVNGMIALETALEAARLTGEVITTPYSFVATAHAIARARLEPVFVDVRAADLNIDPSRIEEAITERTSAIVAVHCYGNPCAVEEIADIARRHELSVIYDAAHAFGVTVGDESLLSFGDFSILSFHATKTFTTFEGGAIVSSRDQDREEAERLLNFGILDEVTIASVGGNGKMNEFSAAVGLLQLAHFAEVRAARRAVDERYRSGLADVAGLQPLALPANAEPNFSYFPVLVTGDYRMTRDELYEALKAQGIFSRRYFHPLLASLPMYRDLPSANPANLPVATRAAEQILCLPIYPDLSPDDQDRVIDILRGEPA
jgi:dTDP-4-amino-4,6-dideoxygalactose transaminase